jgi:hypothetical protein
MKSHFSYYRSLIPVIDYCMIVGGSVAILHSAFPHLWSPLWCSGHSSWLQTQRSWVRFPALSDLLRRNGSGMGSTQPHEDSTNVAGKRRPLLRYNSLADIYGVSHLWFKRTLNIDGIRVKLSIHCWGIIFVVEQLYTERQQSKYVWGPTLCIKNWIHHSRMYRFPGSIIQFLWYLNKHILHSLPASIVFRYRSFIFRTPHTDCSDESRLHTIMKWSIFWRDRITYWVRQGDVMAPKLVLI